MKYSAEEQKLLRKLSSGALDGLVGDFFESSGGKLHKKIIKNGIPMIINEGKSSRFFNGKENENIPGKITTEYFDTDEKKLMFLRKYGWLMNDSDVRAYSAKFKPQR